MNIGKAFKIFKNIPSSEYSKSEKREAVNIVVNAETINSITKNELLNAVIYLNDIADWSEE